MKLQYATGNMQLIQRDQDALGGDRKNLLGTRRHKAEFAAIQKYSVKLGNRSACKDIAFCEGKKTLEVHLKTLRLSPLTTPLRKNGNFVGKSKRF